MPVRRDSRGRWRYRKVVGFPDGTTRRISGTPASNTRWAAERAEEEHIRRILEPVTNPKAGKEVPTFEEWFLGRYMTEWCEGQQNKPGTVVEKRSIFEHHLLGFLGHLRLDQIDVAVIQGLKAKLSEGSNRYRKPLSLKTRNNVLAVLSNVLRYAEEVDLIEQVPKIRPYRCEKPEIETWDFEEWSRLLEGARRVAPWLLVSALLAGDAGLRLGEVLALRWEDVDLVAGRLTVTRQLRKGIEGTPKGGRRRSVPMTASLTAALKALSQVRVGRIVCGEKGEPVAEAALKHGVYRMCKKAGLRERSWHSARHTFATHAARFGVNPWRLQAWLGHSTIAMTMRYVHHVEDHHRPVPAEVLAAGAPITDPDERVIAMLSARSALTRGNAVATEPRTRTNT